MVTIGFAAVLFFAAVLLIVLGVPVRAVAESANPNPLHASILLGAGGAGVVMLAIGFVGMIVSAYISAL